ncbi:MAG: 30S ribosomal protein S2 [Anaerolineales bacterium]|nr:30S ribosomal protein S2 [Anaerolineales bacterium]
MPIVSMKELLESGVHFGHRTQKWNPYMEEYIFAARNDIHIIDLQQTVQALEEAYEVVRDTVAGGGSILFVGTKRQAQDIIKKNAEKVGMPYVIGRWLGGTLTNWQTIRERIHELERLEGMRDRGEFEIRTKKEALGMTREIERLESRLGGIREMDGIPSLLFAVDVSREEIPVHEANLLKIPVVAMVDTNCSPKQIDYVIPANDDAIRGIQLIVSIIAQAVSDGINMRKDHEADLEAADAEAQMPEQLRDELSDEDLLGASTLAKIKDDKAVELDQEKEVEESDDTPAEENEKEESGDTPAEESEKEEPGDVPAEENEKEESGDTPAEESEKEEPGDVPAEENEKEESGDTPAEESEKEEPGDAPAEESEKEESGDAPAEENKEEDTEKA